MTTVAPPTLLAVRALLMPQLGLPAAALGIVGHAAHRGGYHCGAGQLDPTDYSVDESPRDAHPTASSSALDVGTFSLTVSGKRHDLASFSIWLVAQCKAGAADTADIREVIYTTDGVTVKRWDRQGHRTTGDLSHRYHTHISWFRDSEKRDKMALFKRWLTYIGRLAATPTAPTTGDDDVSWNDDVIVNPAWRADAKENPTVQAKFALYDAWNQAHAASAKADAVTKKLDLVLASLTTLSGRDMTDEGAIVKGVLAGLSPAAIVAALPPGIAQDVVDILTERLTH